MVFLNQYESRRRRRKWESMASKSSKRVEAKRLVRNQDRITKQKEEADARKESVSARLKWFREHERMYQPPSPEEPDWVNKDDKDWTPTPSESTSGGVARKRWLDSLQDEELIITDEMRTLRAQYPYLTFRAGTKVSATQEA